MDPLEVAKLVVDGGLGAMSLALFFKLGAVVANHEIRIGKLEEDDDDAPLVPRKRRRPRKSR